MKGLVNYCYHLLKQCFRKVVWMQNFSIFHRPELQSFLVDELTAKVYINIYVLHVMYNYSEIMEVHCVSQSCFSCTVIGSEEAGAISGAILHKYSEVCSQLFEQVRLFQT